MLHGLNVIISICTCTVLLSGCGGGGSSGATDPSTTIRVPGDFATIQAAINVAAPGDTVLVSPGTYRENLTMLARDVTLSSTFPLTSDPLDIQRTIIDGGGNTVVTVSQAASGSTITGFTIQNGDDGISCAATAMIIDNIITDTNDGIDFEGGGGMVARNEIYGNQDDGIDLDGASSPAIQNNVITNNRNDGIEIRLHDYTGTELRIDISNNQVSNNLEDGIQIIDYPGLSSRRIDISRNIVSGNAMVGIGFMGNGNTTEDYSGAQIDERISITNNTISASNYGITGGGNAIIVNNIITDHTTAGAYNASGDSVIAYTLFWNNGTDYTSSTVDPTTIFLTDPQLDSNHTPADSSPVIDLGTASYMWNGTLVLSMTNEAYLGAAPDLGAIESR